MQNAGYPSVRYPRRAEVPVRPEGGQRPLYCKKHKSAAPLFLPLVFPLLAAAVIDDGAAGLVKQAPAKKEQKARHAQ